MRQFRLVQTDTSGEVVSVVEVMTKRRALQLPSRLYDVTDHSEKGKKHRELLGKSYDSTRKVFSDRP